jgi:hypothetical protein
LVGDAQGTLRVVDGETWYDFTLRSVRGPSVQCAYDAAAQKFSVLLDTGLAWQIAIDTTPLSFTQKPHMVLDPKSQPLAKWAGVASGED